MGRYSPFKEIDGIMYRKCAKCKEYKVFDNFNKHKRMAFGVNNTCKVCRKEYREQNKEKTKNYRDKNKERIKEIWREYYEQNKEKIKSYRDKNKDSRIKYDKEYREQNKEKIKKKKKEYYFKNRDKIYKKINYKYHNNSSFKLVNNFRNSNYKNLKRALEYYNNGKSDKLPTKSPSRMLLKLYEIQNHNCPYCFNNMKDDIHIDHIIPLSKNGSNKVHNLILCCSYCNLRKNAKELDIWLSECNINYDEFISDIKKRNEMYFSE